MGPFGTLAGRVSGARTWSGGSSMADPNDMPWDVGIQVHAAHAELTVVFKVETEKKANINTHKHA